jgi:hypothetical protein
VIGPWRERDAQHKGLKGALNEVEKELTQDKSREKIASIFEHASETLKTSGHPRAKEA